LRGGRSQEEEEEEDLSLFAVQKTISSSLKNGKRDGREGGRASFPEA